MKNYKKKRSSENLASILKTAAQFKSARLAPVQTKEKSTKQTEEKSTKQNK